MDYKTFKDFGLTFEFDTNCITCRDGSCHNNVTSKKDGFEYNVHISTNKDFTNLNVYATQNSNTHDSSTIDESFTNEPDAVKFVCENFEWFKCF